MKYRRSMIFSDCAWYDVCLYRGTVKCGKVPSRGQMRLNLKEARKRNRKEERKRREEQEEEEPVELHLPSPFPPSPPLRQLAPSSPSPFSPHKPSTSMSSSFEEMQRDLALLPELRGRLAEAEGENGRLRLTVASMRQEMEGMMVAYHRQLEEARRERGERRKEKEEEGEEVDEL